MEIFLASNREYRLHERTLQRIYEFTSWPPERVWTGFAEIDVGWRGLPTPLPDVRIVETDPGSTLAFTRSAPNGARFDSPGRQPWVSIREPALALKGRDSNGEKTIASTRESRLDPPASLQQ